MVQRCWNKGPLGPSIPWGGFVLLYANDPNDPEAVKFLEEFGAEVIEIEGVHLDPDAPDLPFKYAVVWKW